MSAHRQQLAMVASPKSVAGPRLIGQLAEASVSGLRPTLAASPSAELRPRQADQGRAEASNADQRSMLPNISHTRRLPPAPNRACTHALPPPSNVQFTGRSPITAQRHVALAKPNDRAGQNDTVSTSPMVSGALLSHPAGSWSRAGLPRPGRVLRCPRQHNLRRPDLCPPPGHKWSRDDE
jgi:hypothetical protein